MHTQFRQKTSRLILTSLLGLGLWMAGSGHRPRAQAADSEATPDTAVSGPSIDGFRSAKFGMTEAQLRNAVTLDFKQSSKDITETENKLQRTAVLSVQVPDLVPQGGLATISYVLGYQSHKLIQVNIIWSPEIDPKTTPAMLYQDGETLQQYFAGEGFPPNRSTGNIATPNGILLFRTTDSAGNAVLLILSGTVTKDPKANTSALTPSALTLAYAADAMHPDVFQLSKGSF
jgi:hypothetical protein